MAILISGFMGGFTGRVGNIVGYKYKTGYHIRKLPAKSSIAPTAGQLAQRAKFGLSVAFLSGLRPLLKQLPEKGRQQITAFNYAHSRVLKTAVAGSYPDFSVNYAAVELTSGSLNSGCRHSVMADQTRLIFSWCPGTYNCRSDARPVVLAYNPLKEQWIYHTLSDSEDHMAELYLPCNFKGDSVETYMFFVSADGKAVSDSIYTGQVHISGSFICGPAVNLN